MIMNDFPDGMKVNLIAADTETHTLIDGVQISDKEISKLSPNGVGWFRQHTTVDCYAWLVSDGRYFAWLESFDEFCTFCAEHRVGSVWWYNAKFDFSIIDYAVLSDERWSCVTKGRLKAYQYSSLHSEFGPRYSMKLKYPYRLHGRGHDRHERSHQWSMYDFCNIFGGGLRRILEDFKVTDYDGNPIRKLEMDYQGEIDDRAIQYMKHDVSGLFHAIRLADEFLRDNFGRSITTAKPDIMTAGGLAKKTLLRYLYGEHPDRDNAKRFRFEHKSDLETDKFYRAHSLYRGGICVVNDNYRNKILSGLYRYDINSMYPYVMANMPDIVGYPRRIKYAAYQDHKSPDKVYVLEIATIHGKLKPDFLPVFYDVYRLDYTANPAFDAEQEGRRPFFMFDFEFEELKHWYDFDVGVKSVYAFDTKEELGYSRYVADYYQMKAAAKKEKNKLKTSFAKICLNSAYGKLAQNPTNAISHREINPDTGAVHLIVDDTAYDDSACMSVVQGSFVTAMARTYWMQLARNITQDKPAQYLVYGDTDSFHSIIKYEDTDDYVLGKLKDESEGVPFNFCKYLAPKTYYDGRVNNGVIEELELHTKGINTNSLSDEFAGKSPEYVASRFSPNEKFSTLVSMNVPGGKAIIPIEKYIYKE